MADDDDPVELSAHALNALNEFYREQALLQADSTAKDEIDEDWELSQFWYDDETSSRLADECSRLTSAFDHARIACVSCPTLYKTLRNRPKSNLDAILFEFDTRFERYGDDFVFYDYRLPLDEFWKLSSSKPGLQHSFDVVIADPPFLSQECATKVAEFVRSLVKPENGGKIIFCTGVVAEEYVMGALNRESMRLCDTFEPRHKCKLGNEFRCYVNYDGAFPN